jgi:hypothetical protein
LYPSSQPGGRSPLDSESSMGHGAVNDADGEVASTYKEWKERKKSQSRLPKVITLSLFEYHTLNSLLPRSCFGFVYTYKRYAV